MSIPSELNYTKDHEWIKIDGETATVGVTEHAVNELGDIVFIEFPEPGTELEAGDSIGVIESTKAVSDIFAPISGIVEEINTPLQDAPEDLASDPYGESWLLKIKTTAKPEDVMTAEEYKKYIEEEA